MALTRVTNFVLNGVSRPVPGVNVAVLTQPASTVTQPGSPLASIFSDPAGLIPLTNPVTTDGLGNYSFYIAPGVYTLQIYGNGIPTQLVTADFSVPLVVNASSGTGGQFVNGLGADGNLTYGTPGASAAQNISTNAQTGTSYTVINGDQSKLLTFNNAAAVAVTLPQAGAASSFLAGWWAYFENKGAGTVTITPTTSTIDGASSITLAQNVGIALFSDGANYSTFRGQKSSITASSGSAHQFANAIDGSGNLSYAQPAASDLSNGVTGSGAVVLATSPTIASLSVTGTAALTSSGVVAFNNDTGLSRNGASGAVALGNGTAGDTSGTLTLARTFEAVGNANVTPATVTGVTVATTLISVTTQAGELNKVGRWVRIVARGFFSTGATPGTLAVSLKIGATTLATQSVSPAANAPNAAWFIEADVMVQTAGVTGALEVQSNTAFQNVAVNSQFNTATITGIDVTGAVTFNIVATPSQTTTSITARMAGYTRNN
jgi:hypothetical protein